MENTVLECPECKTRINIKEVKLFQELFTCDNINLMLTYYLCPICDEIRFVQIDDSRSLEILKETRKLFGRLSKSKLDGYDTSQKDANKLKRLNNKLKKQRDFLYKTFKGKNVTDEKGKNFVLKF